MVCGHASRRDKGRVFFGGLNPEDSMHQTWVMTALAAKAVLIVRDLVG